MSSTMVENINLTIDDMVMKFFYYDRKEDEELPLGEIEREVSMKHISTDEIIERFANGVREHLAPYANSAAVVISIPNKQPEEP